MRIRKAELALFTGLFLLAGCNGDDPTGPGGPPDFGECTDLPLSVSPVPVADIRSIVPLGNLNPPGHVVPTGHAYFYLRLETGGNRSVVTPLYAPGDVTVTQARATEHVNAGVLDFALTFQLCNDVSLVYGHVSSLSEGLFGDTSGLDGWEYTGEYSGAGETYRTWERWFYTDVSAGQELGTAGGNPGQWALDVGIYDMRTTHGAAANPDRWSATYLHAACVLDYYPDGEVLNALEALLEREELPGDEYPCGQVFQDIPGTAHGAWFVEGTPHPNPEDNHLALVWYNTRPSLAAISTGNAVPTIPSNAYLFPPEEAGFLNRPFSRVSPDGAIYGYTFAVYSGVILLHMPDTGTLWIEGIPGGSLDPDTWAFTDSKTMFVR
jgi:hypothetical protein